MTTKNLELGEWVQCNPQPGGEQYYLQPVGGSTIFNLLGAGGAVPPQPGGAVPSSACWEQYTFSLVGGSAIFSLWGEYSLQPGRALPLAEDPEFIAVCSEGQAFLLFHLEFPVPGTVECQTCVKISVNICQMNEGMKSMNKLHEGL